MNVADIRVDYTLKSFDENDLEKNPFDQFKLWFDEALKAEVMEPNAMTLATIDENDFPAARIVLLKGIEEKGLIFFTNFESNKGVQLAKNNKAALVFFWPELQRQVRIVGHVAKIEDEQSDLYFNSRPLGSRIGAHASPQSKVIANRKLLEESVKKMEALFAKEPLLRPTNWGGYIVIPISFEFWQGRSSRLHDRFLFELISPGNWKVNRLAP